jgi:flagellar motor switch protein FliM
MAENTQMSNLDEGLMEAMGYHQSAMASSYDFSLPRRLPKDQYAGLHAINVAFAKLVTTYLTTLLRTLVEVKLKVVDYTGYGAFIERRSEPDCLWTFEIDCSEGMGLIEIDPNFVSLLVDRLFGGHGHAHKTIRPTTAIEQNLMSRVAERILHMWEQPWHNWMPVKATLKYFESNPTLVQIAARNEPVINIGFDIEIRKSNFKMAMCMPFNMMSPLIHVVKDQSWSWQSSKKKDQKDQRLVESVVLRADVPMSVQLGQAKLSVREYLDLEPGDVILLSQRTKDPLKMTFGKRIKFWVSPGILNNRKAVKVTSIHKEEEINFD